MERTTKILIIMASVSGFLAVGLGALGSHLFSSRLASVGYTDTYQTAVEYHFYHTLALLGIGVLRHLFPLRFLYMSGLFITAGIFLFSGSLYIVSLTGQIFFAYLTPLGGLLLLAGWIFLIISFAGRSKSL